MRLIAINNCKPGMILAKPIYNEKGSILIRNDVTLTQKMIDSLKARNTTVLYIKDEATKDVEVVENIPISLKVEAVQAIQSTFENLKEKDFKSKKMFNIDVNKFSSLSKVLIDQVKNNKKAMNLLENICVYDNYVFSHSLNVTLYTLALAAKLGFNDKQLNEIAIGGMLHDIGKIYLPFEILNKKGKLTKEEYDIVKEHTTLGFDLLRNQTGIPLLSAHCAFQHHEKVDGTGYPRGLKGDKIHQYAKIMSVADVFDALTSSRAYRKAMLPQEAMEILFAQSNTHFEQKIVELFRQTVATYPVGVTVKLNTNETAVVIDYSFSAPGRPIVRIIKDANGKDLQKYIDIDLSKNLSLTIIECDAII